MFAVKDLRIMLSCRLAAWLSFGTIAALLVGIAGCGKAGSEFQVAPVTGKVVYDGAPVKGGSIRLQPISETDSKEGITGKPASGAVGEDGTFVLSTYGKEDGAVIGKHRVSYLPVSTGSESYNDAPTPSPYVGLAPKSKEVEVKAGENQIDIELVKRR